MLYNNLYDLFGKLAGLLSFLAFIPYILSTLRGKNRPNRATWFIWTLVGVSFLMSYSAVGAQETLWLTIGNLVAFTFVLLLSFKYGEGGWTFFDVACLLGAFFGFALWAWFSSPLPTLFSSILIDAVGALPTIRKAYQNPESEDLLSWIIFFIANLLNLFAIRHWTLVMAAYPVYMVLITFLLVGVLGVRRTQSVLQK
ncbi:MAG: hypothetical protein JNK65_03075 [Deltaproteobacteria bacterium]|nr:hypothetical protein [Deltaproteobacteria bacterium]